MVDGMQQMGGDGNLNRIQGVGMSDRVQSNQNIYNILTESVSKAKDRYAHLAPGGSQQRRRTGSLSNSPD